MGPQNSKQQLDKIMSYVDIGRQEGAQCLIGGERPTLDGELAEGYFFQPTVFKGTNDMRIFQEEIFGPVLAVTTFRDEAEALRIAYEHALWAGSRRVDPRRQPGVSDGASDPGRPGLRTNCYHMYPAGAAFGGYKMSGVGRELYKQTLTEHYTQTKSLLVSYSSAPQGLF